MKKKNGIMISGIEALLLIAIGILRYQGGGIIGQNEIVLGLLRFGALVSLIVWFYQHGSIRNRRFRINKATQIVMLFFLFVETTMVNKTVYLIASVVLGMSIVLFDTLFLRFNKEALEINVNELNISTIYAQFALSMPLLLISTTNRVSWGTDLSVALFMMVYLYIFRSKWWILSKVQKLKNPALTMGVIGCVGVVQGMMYVFNIRGIFPIINIGIIYLIFDNIERKNVAVS